MTWAYSPSYGKPLSVPQGVIGLLTRFGMDVVLAHPTGYALMPETLEVAQQNAARVRGIVLVSTDMREAFEGADVVYPKSWAPFAAMEERTDLVRPGRHGRDQGAGEAAARAERARTRTGSARRRS